MSKEALQMMAREIRTQDNRMTSDPVFTIQGRNGSDWQNIGGAVFFTGMAAQAAIPNIAHELSFRFQEFRVYVHSGFRSNEWQLVRKHLINEQ